MKIKSKFNGGNMDSKLYTKKVVQSLRREAIPSASLSCSKAWLCPGKNQSAGGHHYSKGEETVMSAN